MLPHVGQRAGRCAIMKPAEAALVGHTQESELFHAFGDAESLSKGEFNHIIVSQDIVDSSRMVTNPY